MAHARRADGMTMSVSHAAWPRIKMPGHNRQEWRKSSNPRQAAPCSVNYVLSVCKADMCGMWRMSDVLTNWKNDGYQGG